MMPPCPMREKAHFGHVDEGESRGSGSGRVGVGVECVGESADHPLDGDESDEPCVLAWMPAVSIYFRDPDGHQLEYIAMLAQHPRPDLGVVPLSRWNGLPGRSG